VPSLGPMHIHGDILDKYVTRELPQDELAALDAHVSNCLFCAHALADASETTTTWERRGVLGRLVRAA
jgi:anti-sigma factor RsiW